MFQIKFHFDKKVTTEGLNDTVRVTLKAQDPENEGNELTLTASFANGDYPPRWAERLGSNRGDIVLVTFGETNQQTTLEDNKGE